VYILLSVFYISFLILFYPYVLSELIVAYIVYCMFRLPYGVIDDDDDDDDNEFTIYLLTY